MKNGNCMGTTKLFLETKLIIAGHKVITSILCWNTLDITGLIEKFEMPRGTKGTEWGRVWGGVSAPQSIRGSTGAS